MIFETAGVFSRRSRPTRSVFRLPRHAPRMRLNLDMELDTSKWSGEGAFTERVIDRLQQISEIAVIRVEDAPASRSEADYNFISNEIFVAFTTVEHREQHRRFGFLPGTRVVTEKSMTVPRLEAALTATPDIGAPDYSDDAM